jgi:cell wall-associated NlpC family hydrolase
VLESPLGGGDFGTSGGLPALVQAAQRYLGVRYRWGGKDPATGLDCSGLVYVAFRDIGVTAPRSTWTQVSWKMVRKTGTPSAGDLVWWPGHIGIVVDGKRMINAPHTGAVVRYDSVGVRNGIAPTFLHYTGAGGTLAETTRVPGQAQP